MGIDPLSPRALGVAASVDGDVAGPNHADATDQQRARLTRWPLRCSQFRHVHPQPGFGPQEHAEDVRVSPQGTSGKMGRSRQPRADGGGVQAEPGIEGHHALLRPRLRRALLPAADDPQARPVRGDVSDGLFLGGAEGRRRVRAVRHADQLPRRGVPGDSGEPVGRDGQGHRPLHQGHAREVGAPRRAEEAGRQPGRGGRERAGEVCPRLPERRGAGRVRHSHVRPVAGATYVSAPGCSIRLARGGEGGEGGGGLGGVGEKG